MSNGKMVRLQKALRGMGSVAIAFSGGVDSTFLLHVAHSALGGRAMAVTVRSHLVPQSEMDDATEFCRRNNIHHEILDFDIASQPEIAANPPDRCYHCKKAIFRMLLEFARSHGLAEVAEGSNTDDDGDYRPGHRAGEIAGVFKKIGFTYATLDLAGYRVGSMNETLQCNGKAALEQ